MNSEAKLLAIAAICAAAVLVALIICVTVYQYGVDVEAHRAKVQQGPTK